MDKQLSNIFGPPNSSHCKFLEYLSEIKLAGEDALIKLFLLTLPSYLQDCFKSCCKERGISSFIHLISRFVDLTKPHCQTYEYECISFQDQESSDVKEEIYEERCQPLEEE
jgi:hypothetical protein